MAAVILFVCTTLTFTCHAELVEASATHEISFDKLGMTEVTKRYKRTAGLSVAMKNWLTFSKYYIYLKKLKLPNHYLSCCVN